MQHSVKMAARAHRKKRVGAMRMEAKALIGAFVFVLASSATHAESLNFECGFPVNLGHGAGNGTACYGDPASQEKFLRRGNHCQVNPPEHTRQVLSFSLFVQTEKQSGDAVAVVRERQSTIEFIRKSAEEKKTVESKERYEEVLKGDTQILKVERYFNTLHKNYIDPVTGKMREKPENLQTGHTFILSGVNIMAPDISVLFIDNETSAAIWTSFEMLERNYWSSTRFGHCKRV